MPLDDATLGLLTNREALSINQNASETTVVVPGCDSVLRPTCVWLSRFHDTTKYYLGLFNLGKESTEMGLTLPHMHCSKPYDVWAGKPVRDTDATKGGLAARIMLEPSSALLVRCE